MSNWPGIRLDTQAVDGDGYRDLVNVSHYIEGELTRRPGLASRTTGGGIAATAFQKNGTNWVITHKTGGSVPASHSILASEVGDPAASEVTTFPAATEPVSFVQFGGVLYVYPVNSAGIAIPDPGDPSTVSPIGLPAPIAAMNSPTRAAGNTSPGRHIFRYRYWNSSLNYFGSPSDPVEVLVTDSPTDGELTFIVAPFDEPKIGQAIVGIDNARIDKIIVEMTLAGGDQFYDVAVIDNNSDVNLVVNIDDATLEQRPRRAFGLSVGLATPPQFRHVTAHRGRIFGIRSDDPNVVEWSSPGQPEGFDSTRNSRRVFANTGDTPVALYSVFDDLYIFGQRSVAKLSYDTDPGFGRVDVVDNSGNGLYTKNSLVEVDGVVYGLGPSGAWFIPAGVTKRISRAIDPFLLSDINRDKPNQIHGSMDPVERTVTWWYVGAEFTAPGSIQGSHAVTFDLDRRVWSRRTYQHFLESSTVAYDTQGKLLMVVCDRFRYYAVAAGALDVAGTAAALTLVQAGSTSTVVNVSPAVLGIDSGTYIKNPRTGEIRRASSTSGSVITFLDAWADLVTGDELWVGSIPMTIDPKWSSANGMRNKTRPRKFELSMVPASSGGTGEARVYFDFNESPYVFTAGLQDLFANGVSLANNSPVITFDTGDDGYLCLPMPSDWRRVVRCRIDIEKPIGIPRLLSASFAASESDASVVMDE